MRRREFIYLLAGLVGSTAPDAFGQTSRKERRAIRCAKKKKTSQKSGTRAEAKRNTRKMMKASKKRRRSEESVC